MGDGEKRSETFTSLYLRGRRGSAGARPRQADLFGGETELPAGEVVPAAGLVTPMAGVVKLAPVAAERHVWTVRALVGAIRLQVERQHFSVWVEGEISNCRPAASGHVYFTLKDGEAQLPVVMFRREAQLAGVKPRDGDAVEVRGRVSVYESRGQLQLIAETLELRGAGALEAAFKQLKAKLKAEGLFEQERKRALPAFPKCVGIVSSREGAVIRDIVQVVRRRHARLNLLLYPAAMQGAACAGSVAAGIRWFNAQRSHTAGPVDLIILARGGGSIEDLAGFNDEALARTIAGSGLPIVSAIGHETDVTIADFVADLRAPTPSAAAELVTAAQHRIEERVAGLDGRVKRAVGYSLLRIRQRFMGLSAETMTLRLQDAVNRRAQRVDELRMQLDTGLAKQMRVRERRLTGMMERLQRQEPGVRLAAARRRWERANEALERVRTAMFARRLARVERLRARLEGLSPVAILSRGYALVYAESGALVRDAGEVGAGELIRARLGTGSIRARVEQAGSEIKDEDRRG